MGMKTSGLSLKIVYDEVRPVWRAKGISASRMEQKRSGVTVPHDHWQWLTDNSALLETWAMWLGRGSDRRLWSSWELVEEFSPDATGHKDSRKGTGWRHVGSGGLGPSEGWVQPVEQNEAEDQFKGYSKAGVRRSKYGLHQWQEKGREEANRNFNWDQQKKGHRGGDWWRIKGDFSFTLEGQVQQQVWHKWGCW